MVYIRKGMVRKVVAAVVLSLGLTSCGSAAVSEEKGHLEEKGATAGKNIGDGNAMAVVSETPEVNEEASESSKEKEVTTDSCFTERPVNDIPVFGVEEKDKVRDYLAGLPNRNLTYEEAEERGLIRRIWLNREEDKKYREKFDKQWLDFYQLVTRDDLKWNAEKGEAYHDLAVVEAIVILSYTTEGDPIYEYLSCINGEYYFYSDSSKDEYGGGYYDGSYKDIRVVHEKDSEGNEYSRFYLVNNKKITEEKIKKIIASEDGYNVEKITEVYSLNYFFGKK
jgi:hypothetical protein